MLSNAYFLANFHFDTAENEPAKSLKNLLILLTLTPSLNANGAERIPDPTRTNCSCLLGARSGVVRRSYDRTADGRQMAGGRSSRTVVSGARVVNGAVIVIIIRCGLVDDNSTRIGTKGTSGLRIFGLGSLCFGLFGLG